jgi:raffinose/stachyose/melibiose transport system permease protein
VFPLLRPVTGTVAIFTGLIIWNDFFLSLIYLNGTDKTPLPVAVYTFVGAFASRWNLIFAAVLVSLLPIMLFFLVAQRQLIKGFTGGIKT